MLTPYGPPPAVPSHPNRNLDGGWEETAWKPWDDDSRVPASRLLGVLISSNQSLFCGKAEVAHFRHHLSLEISPPARVWGSVVSIHDHMQPFRDSENWKMKDDD